MTGNSHPQTALQRIRRMIAVVTLSLSLGFSAAQANAAGHSKGDLRVYIFGHSLINDAKTSRSSVPYWMTQLSRFDEMTFSFAGQWGFMSEHIGHKWPPRSEWQIEGAPSFWSYSSRIDSFAEANFNTVLLTPKNFTQYKDPTDGGDNSIVSETLELIDRVTALEPGIDIYIYENWPSMDAYLTGGNWVNLALADFPPTMGEFAAYNAYTLGDFSNWWAEYLAALSSARPDVRMVSIPVGPTIAKMLTETSLLSGIPVEDLYYDVSPHGTPTIYFLASLVTYAGMYGKKPPEEFAVSSEIHPVVQQNYRQIVQFIAGEFGVN
jgi:hypothetical protein